MLKKKFVIFLLLFALVGCTSIIIPNYIQDKNPYKKIFYASYDDSLKATLQTMEDLGWIVIETADPSVYERYRETVQEYAQQILIFTDLRQISLFVGSRYAKLNVYLRTAPDDATEVEIRYLTINSTFLKSFYDYRSDAAVQRIYDHIEKLLK